MALLETVTLKPQPNAKPRQVRISAKVRRAVDAMVDGGLKRDQAAKHAGITDNALYVAMTKPEVKAYRLTRMGVFRESAEARTVAVVDQLLEAESESVRLDAVKYLVPPISKSEITHTHQGHIQGLTIVFAAPTDQPMVIDAAPQQVERAKLIKSLPAPIPHPAISNSAVRDIMGNDSAKSLASLDNPHGGKQAKRVRALDVVPDAPGPKGCRPSNSRSRARPPGGQK